MGLITRRQSDGTVVLSGDTAEARYHIVIRGREIVQANVEVRSEASSEEGDSQAWQAACRRLLHGAVGIAGVTLRIGMAPLEQQRARRAVCEACDLRRNVSCGRLMDLHGPTCGCSIAVKTRAATERCPVGKW